MRGETDEPQAVQQPEGLPLFSSNFMAAARVRAISLGNRRTREVSVDAVGAGCVAIRSTPPGREHRDRARKRRQ